MIGEEIVIPDYQAIDYTDTDKPYAWLYEHRNNKFLLKMLTAKMKEKAGKVGVKNFVTMFNAYCESMAAKQDIVLDRQTEFDGQPKALASGQYICNENGVSVIDKFGFETCICPHPILPVRRLINVDSGEERMELAYRKGSKWNFKIVEKSVLASSQKILDLAAYGIVVTSAYSKALSEYLFIIEDMNYKAIPEKKSVGRLGWIGNHGFSPYIDELEFDGEANFKHIFNAVGQHGDRQKWIDAMRDLRAERGPGRLFLAASFASVILQPCGLLPFFLHAWGGTEVGKTVGLMVAASVWARPVPGEYITTFNSTGVGQEMTAAFLNNLPMCIDELQIQSSAGVRDFDRMIYQLTEGVGKTRGTKTGGLQRQNTWKCCFITSGEHPISNPSSGGGAVNRVIEFETVDKIYHDLVGLCAILNNNYGFAGREFVEYLQTEGALERVNAMQKEIYQDLLKTESTDKQSASASAIIAADRIATELFWQDGNELTIADLTEIMAKREEVSQNVRALDYIVEMVERNPIHFIPDDHGQYKAEVWGCIEEDGVYIYSNMFKTLMQQGGFNASSFLTWANRMGYLLVDNDNSGRYTKRKRLEGSNSRMICLSKDRLFPDVPIPEKPSGNTLPF